MLQAQRQTRDLLWKGDQNALSVPSFEQVVDACQGIALQEWPRQLHIYGFTKMHTFPLTTENAMVVRRQEYQNGTVVTSDF